MRVFTILKNIIAKAKTYTDTRFNDVDIRLTKVEQYGDLIDSYWVQGSATVTIPAPSTWKWMLITCYRAQGNYQAMYQTIVSNDQTTSSGVLAIGGYYISTSDYGLCNLNLTLNSNGGSVGIRNFYYGGVNGLSTAQMYVRLFGGGS